LNLHKKKAKRFFELLKEQTNDSINCSFDMMQTQPLPKLSVTDVFYSRQVWIYNLTFVVSGLDQLNDKCFLYTWNEAEFGRGPNEICSALIDFLEKLEYNLLNSGKSVPVYNTKLIFRFLSRTKQESVHNDDFTTLRKL